MSDQMMRGPAIATLLLWLAGGSAAGAQQPRVGFELRAGALEIRIDQRPLATYVFRDQRILRPYLAHVRSPAGPQVTRNHPPAAGDSADHDTMHPGIWLAFGDLSGADFWRNKARVEHVEFLERPTSDHDEGRFTVKNRYVSLGKTICEERCRLTIRAGSAGFLVVWDSEFSGPHDFYFGDQEEMGLGVRVATPMAVKNGGQLTNSDGNAGEKQVWGKHAAWCDYGGVVEGQPVGILLVPDPDNFGPSWFHARDYGFVAANPFGRRAFTKGETSKIMVPRGQSLRLRYVVLVHSGPVDLQAAYREALGALAEKQ